MYVPIIHIQCTCVCQDMKSRWVSTLFHSDLCVHLSVITTLSQLPHQVDDSSCFILLSSKLFLAIFGPVPLHMNFKIIFLCLPITLLKLFQALALNLKINFGRIDSFTIVMSVNEHDGPLHLFHLLKNISFIIQ